MTTIEEARHLLRGNDLGGYTVPTKGLYPYQWNWDSVFTSLGFAEFDDSRAWQEIETLFDAQWDCGFVPHIVFRKDDPSYFPGPSVWQGRGPIASSGISNPPIAATVVKSLVSESCDQAYERLSNIFPKLLKWHRWFKEVRGYDNSGVVISVHPWEGGRDNSPEWDKPASAVDISNVGEYQRKDTTLVDSDMRPHKHDYDCYIALVQYGLSTNWDHKKIAEEGPYRVIDVGMTMMLLRANRDLLSLAKHLGNEIAANEIQSWVTDSEVGVQSLWNDKLGAFCSYNQIAGESSNIISNASFLNFYAGVGSDAQRHSMIQHLKRINDNCTYLMPSLDPEHEEFDPLRYWRGPVWMVMNYMISLGLIECGYSVWGQKIISDSQGLIAKSGFYEAFSPLDGRGTGGNHFTWTAAMFLVWSAYQQRDTEC